MNNIEYQKLSLEDQQVIDLIAEIKSKKANNKLISDADLKQILSSRANMDQINLALALSQHRNDYSLLFYEFLLILAINLVVFVMEIIGGDIKFLTWEQYLYRLILSLAVFVLLYFLQKPSHFGQTRNILRQTLLNNFNGVSVKSLPLLKQMNALQQDVIGLKTEISLLDCTKINYDQKETYFGRYDLDIGSGDAKQNFRRSFVIQMHKPKDVYPVILRTPKEDLQFPNIKKVEMESNDFNNMFRVNTVGPENSAFHLLDPKLMNIIMEEYKNYAFIYNIEFGSTYIFISCNHDYDIIVKQPKDLFLSYENYICHKKRWLNRLNFISNLSNIVKD